MGTLSLGASIQSSCTGWIVSVGLYSQSGLTGDLGLDGSTMAVGLTTGTRCVVAIREFEGMLLSAKQLFCRALCLNRQSRSAVIHFYLPLYLRASTSVASSHALSTTLAGTASPTVYVMPSCPYRLAWIRARSARSVCGVARIVSSYTWAILSYCPERCTSCASQLVLVPLTGIEPVIIHTNRGDYINI